MSYDNSQQSFDNNSGNKQKKKIRDGNLSLQYLSNTVKYDILEKIMEPQQEEFMSLCRNVDMIAHILKEKFNG